MLEVAKLDSTNAALWADLHKKIRDLPPAAIGLGAADDLYSRVATAEAETGHVAAALRTCDLMHWPFNKALAYAQVAADGHAFRIEHYGEAMPDITIDMLASAETNPRAALAIGAAAVEHWRSFDQLSETAFARLSHGAARIAHSFMTDSERGDFVRNLAGEFRTYRDSGMFEDGRHGVVLKHLGEGLVELKDAGATSDLLQTLYDNMGEATGLRLIKTMVESGNAKAGAAGLDVLYDTATPAHAYQYLLHKLAVTGYLESGLPGAIIDAQVDGFPAWASRQTMQALHHELGIQTDSGLLNWCIDRVKPHLELHHPEPDSQLAHALHGVISEARIAVETFKDLGQAELLTTLANDPDAQALYFMTHGGKTTYNLIQHYNLQKFATAIKTGEEIQQSIDPEAVLTSLWDNAPAGWMEAMTDRRRPSEALVWQFEVGASSAELRAAARSGVRQVFGSELRWLVGDGLTAPDFSSQQDTTLTGRQQQRLQYLLGSQITQVAEGDDLDITIGDLEKHKAFLLAELRQARQSAKATDPETARAWQTIVRQAEAEDPVLVLRHVASLASRDPQLSLNPTGAVAEWQDHVQGVGEQIRDSQRTGKDRRNLTLRYLDGTSDFVELTRFADGAQCCFTSEDTGDGAAEQAEQWRMAINRDPHWFVFSIEDGAPDAVVRTSSGFVFGSLAFVDGQSALAINGVYMQRKTDSAANTIMDQLHDRFAVPLGVEHIVLATKHGGSFNPSTMWRPASGHTLYRPRPMRDTDGAFVTAVYDDLGTQVNTNTVLENQTWIRPVSARP